MRNYFSYNIDFTELSDWKEGTLTVVECPDADDYSFMEREVGVPSSFIEDIADTDELPRVETEGDWLLAIVRIPLRNEDDGLPFITVPVGVMARGADVVTLCFSHCNLIPDLLATMRRKHVAVRNHVDLILWIVFAATDWFLKYLRQINSEVESDEKKLRKSITNADLIQLRDLQKTLVYFNTSIRGNQVMTDRLSSLYQEKELLDVDLLEDLVIELKQAFNTVSVYTEILNATMDSYASIISNNLNVIMKRMTSFSIALMIPTLVASFYGMNVINHAENSYQREFGIRNTLKKLNRQLEKSCRFF
ncbi:MAG: magnesium transporter CorA family protein [Muribaculaceae bacterium]|nr:magnesium transporter CorA family protein [Muribaculaceae bacterium]